MKKYFALKLIAPRTTFPMDMSAEERAIMQQHVAYWKDLMDKGFVVAFGPVLDPNGVYGLGIIEAESEVQVNSFIANDPATQINKYEAYPMMAVVPAVRHE